MKKLVVSCLAVMMLLTGCGDKTGYAEDGYGEGRMGDTMHTYFFDYTVNSAYLCPEFEGYTPHAGGLHAAGGRCHSKKHLYRKHPHV